MYIMERNEKRKAITNHAMWPAAKLRDGLNSERLSAETIERLIKEFGIDTSKPLEGYKPEDDAEAPEATSERVGEVLGDKAIVEKIADGLSEEEAAMLKAMREARDKAAREAAKNAGASEARIIELIDLHSPKPAHVKISLKIAEKFNREMEGLFHWKFGYVLTALNAGLNVMLVGPAGSGKTTIGEQCAKAFGLDFYFNGAIASEYKLSGFIDAQGRVISTAFRKAFEFGGVYLFDEIDASMPAALLAFNAALANGHADFPDGNIKRHPDFKCIAAANTFGTGQSRVYVGRNQQDAALTDRFVTIELPYDLALEAGLLNCPRPSGAKRAVNFQPREEADLMVEVPNALARVRRIRDAVEKLAIRHVVSPRASMAYAKLLAAGWSKDDIEESCIWKGLETASRQKIEAAL